MCFEACGREWFLSVWLSFFGSSSYFHFDSEIFITTKKAFVEAIKSALLCRERIRKAAYFCGAAASKFEPIYFDAKVEARSRQVRCAWTRKSINAHRAPHIKYIMLCILCFLFCLVCVPHACPANQGPVMQLHVKGSRHHKLPTLFLFPHVYKCIFSSKPARCLPKLLFIQTSAHTDRKPSLAIIRVCG